jgi:cytochrome b561
MSDQPASDQPASDDRRENRILYGRIAVSVVLYALFIIFSTSAVLTRSLSEKPFLLGGLLIGAVFLLPRNARRAKKDFETAKKLGKWLTFVRLGYFLIAAFLWFGLPELV